MLYINNTYNELSTQQRGIKMSSKPVEKYLLRVDAELMQWIREQAEANHRTISGQYRLMLEMAREEIESEHA